MISVIVEDRYIIISMHRCPLCQVPLLQQPASQHQTSSGAAVHFITDACRWKPTLPSGAPQSPAAQEKVQKIRERKTGVGEESAAVFLSFLN